MTDSPMRRRDQPFTTQWWDNPAVSGSKVLVFRSLWNARSASNTRTQGARIYMEVSADANTPTFGENGIRISGLSSSVLVTARPRRLTWPTCGTITPPSLSSTRTSASHLTSFKATRRSQRPFRPPSRPPRLLLAVRAPKFQPDRLDAEADWQFRHPIWDEG